MKPTVYLETSVISYLASEISRDLIIAGHQQITHDWWDNYRERCDLRISQLVIQEIDFILTWNCRHIANLFIQKDLSKILARKGFRLPIIGTPEALMGELS